MIPAPSSPAVIVPGDFVDRVVDAIAERGLAILERVFAPEFVAALGAETQAFWSSGDFQQAGIGRQAELRPEIRSDHVLWLDPASLTGLQQAYWQVIEELRLRCNRDLYLGVQDFEAHFAVYPPGSFYQRHLDRFQASGRRTLSCLLYLNEGWQPGDGGQLRAWLPGEGGAEQVVEVLPEAGTFVCFPSDALWHEVLPARRERFSLTGWLRRPA